MEPISLVEALSSTPKPDALSARLISSFGNEINQLISATLESPASTTLGTKVDVKA